VGAAENFKIARYGGFDMPPRIGDDRRLPMRAPGCLDGQGRAL
jgi:hypothetical protein